MKKTVLIIIISSIFFLLLPIGFWVLILNYSYKYSGPHPDLVTEAINTLLSAKGYFSDGECLNEPYIEIVDQDDYGRTLYKYSENSDFNGYCSGPDPSVSEYSLLIIQKSTDSEVFFYEDANYLLFADVENDLLVQEFLNENDWNEAIDLAKCISYQINTEKEPFGPLCHQSLLVIKCNNSCDETFFEEVTDAGYRYSEFYLMDDYDRSIYIAYGYEEIYIDGKFSSYGDYVAVVMLFNPDASYDINKGFFILEFNQSNELGNYKDDLIKLKLDNNWNVPPA